MLTSARNGRVGKTDVRIYLDAPPVIYSIQDVSPFADIVKARLSDPEVVQIVSDLTRMECRVKPIRERSADLLLEFDNYFHLTVAEIISLDLEVMDKATDIRAAYRFKTPDAIHLAAAVVSGCDVFLTNDHRLDRFTGIAVETLLP
jgi:uncharacterized protein